MTLHVALFGESGLGNLGDAQSCRAARTSVGAEVAAVAALLDGVLEKR